MKVEELRALRAKLHARPKPEKGQGGSNRKSPIKIGDESYSARAITLFIASVAKRYDTPKGRASAARKVYRELGKVDWAEGPDAVGTATISLWWSAGVRCNGGHDFGKKPVECKLPVEVQDHVHRAAIKAGV